MATELNYNDFVVVAEDEWELECPTTTNISEHLGGFKWKVTFVPDQLSVECVELKEGTYSGKVHMELFVYSRENDNGSYKLLKFWQAPNPSLVSVVLGVRILKDRSLFHDFTVDQPIGHLKNDVKLQVGEQIFHLNKQLLEVASPYFHRMFNSPNFVEANQGTIDTGETDAALFHDFLLAFIPIPSSKYKMLPNSKNLAGLMRLANYHGVDSLFDEFGRSLKFLREKPMTERVLLAKKYMGKEFNVAGILHGVNSPEEWKHNFLALFKADD